MNLVLNLKIHTMNLFFKKFTNIITLFVKGTKSIVFF